MRHRAIEHEHVQPRARTPASASVPAAWRCILQMEMLWRTRLGSTKGRARVECRGMRRQLVRASAVGDDVAVT